jgi:hypothetical protein
MFKITDGVSGLLKQRWVQFYVGLKPLLEYSILKNIWIISYFNGVCYQNFSTFDLISELFAIQLFILVSSHLARFFNSADWTEHSFHNLHISLWRTRGKYYLVTEHRAVKSSYSQAATCNSGLDSSYRELSYIHRFATGYLEFRENIDTIISPSWNK